MTGFKTGDDVLVWVTVVQAKPDEDGDIMLASPTSDAADDTFFARPEAIVLPAEGQEPPWSTSNVALIAKVLMTDGHMPHDAAFSAAGSLDRAGVRVSGATDVRVTRNGDKS